jgi:plastocyanin
VEISPDLSTLNGGKMKRRIYVPTLIAIFAVIIPLTSRAASRIEVQIEGFAYVPSTVNIMTGDTVEWINRDAAAHTSTSGKNGTPDGIWDSGLLSQNQSYFHVFNDKGSFDYYCKPHTWMTGIVNVEPMPDTTDTIPDDTIPPGIIEDNFNLLPALEIDPAVIRFHIPASSNVRIDIYDLLGTQTDIVASGTYPAGSHEITRPRLQPGIYFVRLRWGNVIVTRKLVEIV